MSDTRRWTVTSCELFRSGEKNGKPWEMYVLTATDEYGNPVIEGVKSFQNVPLGANDFYVDEGEYRGEREYTIRLVNQQLAIKTSDQGGWQAKFKDLENRVDRLERQINTDVPLPGVIPQPAKQTVPDDDDIPF
jgi:hypothetical protein